MSSTTSQSKKGKTAPPRGRPASSSVLAQPVVEDASSLTALSTFSPKGNYFALLSLAIDKHRLRVHDTATGQSIAEHIVQDARVATLSWTELGSSEHQGEPMDEDDAPKKKRKKRNSLAAQASSTKASETSQVVLLGLSNGSLLVFSPSHGRVLRTLSHSSSTAAILSLSVSQDASNIWTSGADSSVHVWNAHSGEHLSSWKTDDRIPCTALSICKPNSDDHVDFLLAHHSIRLLSSTSHSSPASGSSKPKELATFTGHASNITSIHWVEGSIPKRFVSMAEADRHVYVWEVPEAPTTEGKLVASIPLDSDARQISVHGRHLLVLSASGKISVFELDSEDSSSSPTKKSKQKVLTLSPRSSVSTKAKRGTTPVEIASAAAVPGEEGHVRMARLIGGVRPVFDVVEYLDQFGNFIPEVIVMKDVYSGLVDSADVALGPSTKRYAESSNLAVRSGVELGQEPSTDDLALRDIDGALDVDIAELSLGQRLTALDPGTPATRRTAADADSDSSVEDNAAPNGRNSHRRQQTQDDDSTATPAMSSITLTRTLIQALHSSDSKLLEMCLSHSDSGLIMHTVRRLPPQLAVPLVVACVERLGRGKRAGSGKGGGAGASSQRGMGLVRWVKTVLVVHSGHLMTMPDLVARLSGLHATLTTRLTLQDSLLSLSGRLEMVLQQIELRSSAAPAPISQPPHSSKTGKKKGGTANGIVAREPVRYVEGESEDEDEDAGAMDVEVEEGSEAGSIEDVELGGESASEDGSDEDEDEEDEELDDDDEDDEDEDEDGAPKLNGFVDDEAEEDEDSEEESE